MALTSMFVLRQNHLASLRKGRKGRLTPYLSMYSLNYVVRCEPLERQRRSTKTRVGVAMKCHSRMRT